ncbi:biotin/lipoyl-binding protein [uncultured Ruminococcus sp.]|uniref:efflux RND transporter periplasmic adaptor subunit n=1 Tax=uncultured Ruminococcus sp. TaxID=165186 RepID=UPI0025D8C295|nr:biotin/lipoyl-binding protein [uncultured Ruminococcus sp.]
MKEKFKQKALKYFIIFLLVMFVMTFISRMIYTNKLPRVTATQVSYQSLSHQVECSGTLEARKKTPVFVPEGIKIADKAVKNGDKVEKGDTLIRLDKNDLSEQIKKLENEISTDINSGSGVYNAGSKNPVFALSELRISEIPVKVGDHIESGQYVMKLDPSYLYDKVCDLYNELESDRQSYNGYIEEGNYSSADAMANSIEVKERKYNKYNALSANGGMIYSDFSGIVTDVLVKTGDITTDSAVIMVSGDAKPNYAFSEKESKLEKLRTLAEADGNIQSPIDGVVSDVTLNTGNLTTAEAVATVADVSGGLIFNAEVTENDTKFISVGDTVSVRFRNGKKRIDKCEITSIVKNESGEKYNVQIPVSDNELKVGEIGTLSTKVLSEEKYDCLPIDAVNNASETNGFIYVIDESEGFLGKEYVLRKKKVNIKEKNDTMYGVDSLAEADDSKIVISSSKKLNDGQKVRLISGEN